MQASVAPAQTGRGHIQLYASDAASPIRWRLLGGNNRELGRGTGEFADRDACVLGIRHLKNVIDQLEVSLHRNDEGTWGWLLCLGGVSVAASGHRYDRQIRCRQGLAQFIAAFGLCEVGGGLMYTHSRRWHSWHGRAALRGRDQL